MMRRILNSIRLSCTRHVYHWTHFDRLKEEGAAALVRASDTGFPDSEAPLNDTSSPHLPRVVALLVAIGLVLNWSEEVLAKRIFTMSP